MSGYRVRPAFVPRATAKRREMTRSKGHTLGHSPLVLPCPVSFCSIPPLRSEQGERMRKEATEHAGT